MADDSPDSVKPQGEPNTESTEHAASTTDASEQKGAARASTPDSAPPPAETADPSQQQAATQQAQTTTAPHSHFAYAQAYPYGYPVVPQHPQPPDPFENFWPAPSKSLAPRVLIAALIAGIAAAIFIPTDGLGVGITAIGFLIAGGFFLVRAKVDEPWDPVRVLWTVLGLALVTVPAFRAAAWLSALCMLAACLAGILALSTQRRWRDYLISGSLTPISLFRAIPWVIQGTLQKRTARGMRLALSIVASVVLLVIFAALFAGADENFARIIEAIIPDLDAETLFRWTLILGIFAAAGLASTYLLARPMTVPSSATPRSLRRLEWAIPVSTLVVLFALFIAVQATTLFGGDQLVRATTGLTYADHARGGFWQLTIVSMLTLGIIAAVARWAPKESAVDRNVLRGIAGALAVLTLVIVASALFRMAAYQDAYGFTVLRLLVQSCEIWIGLVYVLIIAAGIRLNGSWLPVAILSTGLATLLALAVLNPDSMIASKNVERLQATGKIDEHYLENLSADAVPALADLPAHKRHLVVESIEPNGQISWQAWNLSDATIFSWEVYRGELPCMEDPAHTCGT